LLWNPLDDFSVAASPAICTDSGFRQAGEREGLRKRKEKRGE